MLRPTTRLSILPLLVLVSVLLSAATAGAFGPRHVARPDIGGTSAAAVPTGSGFPGTVLLGQPTDTAITLSLMATSAVDVYVERGPTSGGPYTIGTRTTAMKAGTPAELTLTGLSPNSAWFYRIRYRTAGTTSFKTTVEQSFRTQRSAGSSFAFAVEADPHVNIDRKMQPALFRQELANVLAGRPDFVVDLGDTFLGDKFAQSYTQLAAQYANVRAYFGIVGPSVPLFLVNGNHEGEAGWLLNGTANNLSVWAANARKTYYPQPSAGSFYSGGTIEEPFIGRRDSYYAWEWGDALFVVLDPYSYTTVNPKQSGDLWDYTLGEDQYRWLVNVLSTSASRYKFVFSHHILGDVRGGVEWAGLYEWGGAKNGAYQFDVQRPGWGTPIRDLFNTYGVTIFFQGHDHLYVRQEADGVVYQEVTQPASPSDQAPNADAYKSGVILGGTGHLKVTVSSSGVTVDYVRSSANTKGGPGPDNGRIVYRYTIPSTSTSAGGR